MSTYIIRRFIVAIPLLLAMSFVTFVIIHVAPGDYFADLRLNPQISPETIRKMEAQYGLDKPALLQYFYWLRGLATLDMGYSFARMQPVSRVIAERLFNTVILFLASMLVTWLLAIPLGIYCAVRQYSWGDKVASVFSYVGISVPNFFFALILLYLASLTGLLPLGGMRSVRHFELSPVARAADIAVHLVVPTVVIATSAVAGLQRLMRGNMLEVLRAQYVVTARAKGLPETRVIYVHALRNAINPMITIFGFQFSSLLSGAALTEIVCNWPGLGSLMLEAVRTQDIFLVMGDFMIAGVLLIVGNLLADVLLAWSDPTIRLG